MTNPRSPTRSERTLSRISGQSEAGSARLNALGIGSVLDFWRQSVGCSAHWGRPKLVLPTESELLVEHHTSHIRRVLTRSKVQPALSIGIVLYSQYLYPQGIVHTVLTTDPVFTSIPTFSTTRNDLASTTPLYAFAFAVYQVFTSFSRKCPSPDPLHELSSRLSELLPSPSDPSLWPHVNRAP